jgi:NAD(P)-dependent dehydrogenase (short-subunit alcohol dehydrogenase family)
MHVNASTPALLIAALKPSLQGKHPTIVASLSARVGSIGDNGFGGWYAYRASKAALNMMMKSAAIEYRRRARNCKLAVFHPGTTDTPLSGPFQSNVPVDRLFPPAFVAARLDDVLAELPFDGKLGFVAWDGQSVPW